MNHHKVGLVLGSMAAFLHVVWSLLVGFGWAQSWLDFVYRMHSLNNPFTVAPFDWMRSIGLIVVAFIIWYVMGHLFVVFWKKLHK